jgi:hypothetical protein
MSDSQWDRLEKELFGEATAAGINFDAYDDIPTETSGRDVPDAIQSFEDVELDPAVPTTPAMGKPWIWHCCADRHFRVGSRQ